MAPPPDLTPAARLRAGVVGTGFIGVVHVDALRRIGDMAGFVAYGDADAEDPVTGKRCHCPAAQAGLWTRWKMADGCMSFAFGYDMHMSALVGPAEPTAVRVSD